MDESYAMFIRDFGGPNFREIVPDEVISRYTGIFPENFLSLWKEFGWCSFQKGLFWTVNPDLYVDRLRYWIDDIPGFKSLNYIVFGRTAFGSLYAWSPDTDSILEIECIWGYIMIDKKYNQKRKHRCVELESFFACADSECFQMCDSDELDLFDRAYLALGELAPTEVYGFQPLLVLGGEPVLENLKKLRMDVHLDIMRQFTKPVLRLV